MKRILLVLAIVTYFINKALAEVTASQCPTWQCQRGLGEDQTGTNRTCARNSGTSNFAEECDLDNHFCLLEEPTLQDSQNCEQVEVLSWKRDLPAGDDCGGLSTCYGAATCTTIQNKTRCAGLQKGDECTDDRECNPGLYCKKGGVFASDKCDEVAKQDQECDNDFRCEFGTQCVNSTCTRFGNLTVGTRFEILDNKLLGTITKDTLYNTTIGRVCETFFAFNTGVKSDNGNFLFECTEGLKRNFEIYARTDDNLDCSFNHTFSNGTSTEYKYNAVCGFNIDEYFYCPSRRGADEYGEHNRRARDIWASSQNLTCHHRSSIQYCPAIQDNFLWNKAFADIRRTEFITEGDNWPLVANSDRCVGRTIKKTMNYWRIVESSYSNFIGLVALSAFITSFMF
ncbi:unnamed protein product [Moneuplotes crassus]|uniref:Uncharacterized protein n=1 Tax=Euplotes crassus TaxID=5936 RepID=A0AAD1XGD9_EUPCR|nr:unnamed protein product [Moneuplotes crassus]